MKSSTCSKHANIGQPVEASILLVDSPGVSGTNPMRFIMGYQVIEQIRELFKTLIAPQLEGIKGAIRALDAKFDAKF